MEERKQKQKQNQKQLSAINQVAKRRSSPEFHLAAKYIYFAAGLRQALLVIPPPSPSHPKHVFKNKCMHLPGGEGAKLKCTLTKFIIA